MNTDTKTLKTYIPRIPLRLLVHIDGEQYYYEPHVNACTCGSSDVFHDYGASAYWITCNKCHRSVAESDISKEKPWIKLAERWDNGEKDYPKENNEA